MSKSKKEHIEDDKTVHEQSLQDGIAYAVSQQAKAQRNERRTRERISAMRAMMGRVVDVIGRNESTEDILRRVLDEVVMLREQCRDLEMFIDNTLQ